MKSAQSPSVWDQVLILLVFGVGAYALGLVFAGEFIGDQLFDRLGFGHPTVASQGEWVATTPDSSTAFLVR